MFDITHCSGGSTEYMVRGYKIVQADSETSEAGSVFLKRLIEVKIGYINSYRMQQQVQRLYQIRKQFKSVYPVSCQAQLNGLTPSTRLRYVDKSILQPGFQPNLWRICNEHQFRTLNPSVQFLYLNKEVFKAPSKYAMRFYQQQVNMQDDEPVGVSALTTVKRRAMNG